jgi:small subunit ribosomal protein S16
VAVKIRLLRMGKIRNPQYRIVVADSRVKRDGRAIEYLGVYHPKEEPSLIEVNSERAQYWLSVGAQPSEPVQRILEKTGDWQKFKGLPAPEPLKVKAPQPDRRARYDAESQAAAGLTPAEPAKATKKAAKKAAPAAEPTATPAPAPAASAPAAQPAAPAAPEASTPAPELTAPVAETIGATEATEVTAAAEAPATTQNEESTGADAGTQA